MDGAQIHSGISLPKALSSNSSTYKSFFSFLPEMLAGGIFYL
jgi:hypothetical protein